MDPEPTQLPVSEEADLDLNDVAEEIHQDEDVLMESDQDMDDGLEETAQQEVELVNDSRAYFDLHKDSIFAIANHPLYPEELFITGGGDDVAYIWGIFPEENMGEHKVIPQEGRKIMESAFEDSVVATGFSRINGEFVAAAGLDGRLKVWRNREIMQNKKSSKWEIIGEVREVEEIHWIEWNPRKENIIAFGAGDGSVWIYEVDESENELRMRHAFYSHTALCTAGQWVADGSLLCTVSVDGTFYVWDLAEGRSLIGLTQQDSRFEVEGGLVSIAINYEGTVAVVGGAKGTCKVVGLPRSSHSSTINPSASSKRKTKGSTATTTTSSGVQTAGQILATLQGGTESVESIAFSKPPIPLLVTSSVDGNITIFDASRQYAVRKVVEKAHEDAIVKVEFAPGSSGGAITAPVVLTSCSTDKTVKRWDAKTGTELGVWRGHVDGILGFVQTERVVVTAGDDDVALLYDTTTK